MTDEIEALEARIEALEAANERKDERIEALEGTVESQGKKIVRHLGYIVEQGERIEALEAGADESAENASQDDGRSPLAQIIDVPHERAKEALTANQERGRRVAQRAIELGTRTPNGLVVKSGDIAKQLKQWGESDHSETVSRIMDFIAEFGKGDVRSKMHKGKRILVFDPDRVAEYGKGEEPETIVSRRDVIRPRRSGAETAPA